MVGLKPKIFMAGFVGMGLVSWAFYSAHIKPPIVHITPELTVASSVLSTDRKALAVADSNNDGVEDWKEALQQTIPASYEAHPTSTYILPETLTDQAGIALVQGLITARGMGPLGENDGLVVSEVAESIIHDSGSDVLITESEIRIVNSNDKESLRTYGETVAKIVVLHGIPSDTKNEAEILNEALISQNPNDLADLSIIRNSYEGMVRDLLLVPVPSELQTHHLDVLNSLRAIESDVGGMQEAFTDPMRALVRIHRYESDVVSLGMSFSNLYRDLGGRGITWRGTDQVSHFIGLFR